MNCAAGGGFRTSGGLGGAFTISESGGTWQPAQRVPGIPLRVVHSSKPYGIAVTGISCPAAGDCSAVIDDGVAYASYVMDEADGIWGPARLIQGTTRSFLVSAVSCPVAGACLASGNEVASGNEAGSLEWVLAKSVAASSLTAVSLAKKTVPYGDEEAEKVTATVRATGPASTGPAPTGPAPAGKVTVTAAGQPVCAMTLKAGTGSCTVPPARFARGAAKLTARYAGGAGFAPGTPVTQSVAWHRPVHPHPEKGHGLVRTVPEAAQARQLPPGRQVPRRQQLQRLIVRRQDPHDHVLTTAPELTTPDRPLC